MTWPAGPGWTLALASNCNETTPLALRDGGLVYCFKIATNVLFGINMKYIVEE